MDNFYYTIYLIPPPLFDLNSDRCHWNTRKEKNKGMGNQLLETGEKNSLLELDTESWKEIWETKWNNTFKWKQKEKGGYNKRKRVTNG